MKKANCLVILLFICLTMIFTGCDSDGDSGNTTGEANTENSPGETGVPAGTEQVETDGSVTVGDVRFSAFDLDESWDDTAIEINLKGETAEVEGEDPGVTVEGGIVTIKFEGTYILSGTLSDGQIRVEVAKTEKEWKLQRQKKFI